MARKRKPYEITTEEANMMPIMGLMVVLIPMVLLMTVFVSIGVINVSAPKIGIGSAKEMSDDEKKPLNLTIGISEKGFTIAATGGVLPGEEAKAPEEGAEEAAPVDQGPTIPTTVTGTCDGPEAERPCGEGRVCPDQCGNGNVCRGRKCLTWDYLALYNRMVEIKDAYPDESIVNLGADDTIPYGTVVATMDAVRRRREKDKYDKLDEFLRAAFGKDADGKVLSLFSDVVLAVIQ